ncbi:PA2169 family four-helix-bundle protein [Planctomicrobium sp. SH661]|uniref:PA2169 family four-helix-bundle protein n=1 Tax=Planctomicrobium sp. SH661 TaxID=3448124 RepID=UPI003F5B0B7F
MALETKTQLNQETINKLQELIQINIDSKDGFEQAAREIEDMTLSTLFQSLAHQREEQANQLSQYVQWNHEQPNRTGSYAAAIHRGWMSIREMISGNNLYSVLAEAERGEDQIKAAYEGVLKETAGSAMNDVLTQQYAQVKAAHDRIRDLRDEHKA